MSRYSLVFKSCRTTVPGYWQINIVRLKVQTFSHDGTRNVSWQWFWCIMRVVGNKDSFREIPTHNNANNHKAGIFYRTGDFGKIQDGRLIYQGRQDSEIKVRGHRVNMREIEQVISGVPGVDMVVTIACDTKAGFRCVHFSLKEMQLQFPGALLRLQLIQILRSSIY